MPTAAKILVVDDQAFVRRTIRSMIADRTAWQVSEAENGRAAVEATKKKQPEVVVLDIVMPVIGGLAAAYEIGKIAPQTKIVFISSPLHTRSDSRLGTAFRCCSFRAEV